MAERIVDVLEVVEIQEHDVALARLAIASECWRPLMIASYTISSSRLANSVSGLNWCK